MFMSLKKEISQYSRRISLVSAKEIRYRIQKFIEWKAKQIYSDGLNAPNLLDQRNISWYIDKKDRTLTPDFLMENSVWDEVKAKKLLEHKFTFFSFKDKFFGDSLDWHRDYKNDRMAPLKFCSKIKYQSFDQVGDFKYIWEINRHQHLITLAKAYWITNKPEYKDEVKGQILDWIKQNPFMKGINWRSSLELGIRLISWSWVWFFLGDIEPELREPWLQSIYQHCVYIEKNFSRYSSANNHLIGEAAGLFIASVVWPFENDSKKWKEKSYKILVQEIKNQNYSDGVNKEQAISYQQFVMDFFILAGLLGEKNDKEFPEYYWIYLEKMMEFIASVMDSKGSVPRFGDSDDGYAVTLSDDEDFNPYKSLLSTGAVIFNRGDFKQKSGGFDEKALWLLGVEGFESFKKLDKDKFSPTNKFDKGGYFILSHHEDTENEIKAVFDCGSLGYLSLAAHGHADALSFVLNIGGRKFLIDPGTYKYHIEEKWRNYFRGTSAHNTIRIDRKDQSVIGGNFMWTKKAKSKLIKWVTNDRFDIVEGVHDGYMRLNDPVLHKRKIIFNKKDKYFIIRDKIESKKEHLIEQFFHFSNECKIRQISQREWQIKNDGKTLSLKMDGRFKTNLVCGSKDPILGWKSDKFDVKEKINTFVNSVIMDGNYCFVTKLSVK